MKVLQRNAIRLLINCVGPGALPRSRPPHQQCSVINLFPRHTASTPVDLGQARLGRLSIIVTTRPALAITITTVIVAAVDVAALVRRASFRFFLPVPLSVCLCSHVQDPVAYFSRLSNAFAPSPPTTAPATVGHKPLPISLPISPPASAPTVP